MAKKNFYAVRTGKVTGIFQTWDECKASVDGYPGAKYKGFPTKEAAKEYLKGGAKKKTVETSSNNVFRDAKERPVDNVKKSTAKTSSNDVVKKVSSVFALKPPAKIPSKVPKDASTKAPTAKTSTSTPAKSPKSPKTATHTDTRTAPPTIAHLPGQVVAYVDGSFDKKIKRYSFGCVLITPDGEIGEWSGNGDNPDSLALRNVTGEMLGAMFAVKWCIKNDYPAVDIRYDYSGIEMWATGKWKTNNPLTQKYAAYMRQNGQRIKISFTKIAAHTGDYYNEMADKLAKKALTEGNGIPEIKNQETPA